MIPLATLTVLEAVVVARQLVFVALLTLNMYELETSMYELETSKLPSLLPRLKGRRIPCFSVESAHLLYKATLCLQDDRNRVAHQSSLRFDSTLVSSARLSAVGYT